MHIFLLFNKDLAEDYVFWQKVYKERYKSRGAGGIIAMLLIVIFFFD